jgi:hypothetical protein
MGTTASNMIRALELGTGLTATKHVKYDNQFYFNVGGVALWVGCYAEYEITANGQGKSGTRVPCSLVEAAAYVKSAGTVFPGGRGTVSGGLYQKSESQRAVNAASDIFGQVMAMLVEAPVQTATASLVQPTVVSAADALAALRAKKAAPTVSPRAARKAELEAAGATEEEVAEILAAEGL